MKNKYILILFLAVCVMTFSCLPEDHLEYSGPTLVEFKNYTLGQLTSVLTAKGVSNSSSTGTQTDSSRTVFVNVRGTDTVLVQLVGPQRNEPTVINYSVRSTSTAVEGTHYNFKPTGARSVTIPANSSFGYILMEIIPGSVTSGTVNTKIDLLGNETIKANPNYDAFIVTIRP